MNSKENQTNNLQDSSHNQIEINSINTEPETTKGKKVDSELTEHSAVSESKPINDSLLEYIELFQKPPSNAKKRLSFRRGSTASEIMELLKYYRAFPQNRLNELIPHRKKGTIDKVVLQLYREGYIDRQKGFRNEYALTISKTGRIVLGLEPSVHQKKLNRRGISRRNRKAESEMMFISSQPNESDKKLPNEYKDLVAIRNENPQSDKALSPTRMIGVYTQCNNIYPIFNMGDSTYFGETVEKLAKSYIENRIYRRPVNGAIFFVSSLDESVSLLHAPQQGARNTISNITCYEVIYIIPIDANGIEQLRLFRSMDNIDKRLLDVVYDKEEIDKSPSEFIDALITDINNPKNKLNSVIMYSCDFVKLQRIINLFNLNMINNINIICFDFQEAFFKTALNRFPNVSINSYSINEVRGALF